MMALVLVALAPPPRIAAAPPVDVRRDIEYASAGGTSLLLDAYVPPTGPGPRPAVVMIHGGGWRTGDKAWWADEGQRFAGRGWVAFSINYRLDEPVVFPAEIDDVQAAVGWVRSHAGDFGVDPGRIAAVGDSAGGHLTAMLATLGRGPLDVGARIRAGVAWSPPTDLGALAGSRGDGWTTPLLGCTLATCPDRLAEASPVTHVDPTDAPLYLVSSSEEQVPLSQSQAMAERLAAAGVDHRLDVFPGSRHGLDYRDDAWAPTLAFLEAHLGSAPEPGSSPLAPWAVGFAVGGLAATVLVVRWRDRSRRSRP